MKIFLEYFNNEIIPDENFPDYGSNRANIQYMHARSSHNNFYLQNFHWPLKAWKIGHVLIPLYASVTIFLYILYIQYV